MLEPAEVETRKPPRILIKAERLSKKHGRRSILQSINFTLHAGEIVTLIGPNGSGKTTLLRCLLGLERADEGRILRKREMRLGYVPQHIHFEATMPLSVSYFLQLSSKRPVNFRHIIELTAIESLMGRQMRHLSGGELQRVLLAQALLDKPELLVLDEPVQGVDFSGQAELYRLIRKVSREYRMAVLMVSHDLHLVMADTDRVLCLNGHICCAGSPHKVSQDPAFVELFGQDVARQIAFYVHHHDHHHELDGRIVDDCDAGHMHGEHE